MLLGFLLLTVMLIPLSQVVSPLYAIIAILTVINLTRVSSLGIFSWVGAWRIRSASSTNWHPFLEKNTAAHFVDFVVLPNYHEDVAVFEGTL